MVFRPTHLIALLSAMTMLGTSSSYAQVRADAGPAASTEQYLVVSDLADCSFDGLAFDDNIVWGTLVTGDGTCGASLQGDDNIVWGTDASLYDNIVWGTRAADNIVWGTRVATDGDNGGLSADDNIVWGTSLTPDDNIVWGTVVTPR